MSDPTLEETLSNLFVGQALTFPHRGIDGACQLILKERTALGDTHTYVFSVFLYGVLTGKELMACRVGGRWTFSDTKVKKV